MNVSLIRKIVKIYHNTDHDLDEFVNTLTTNGYDTLDAYFKAYRKVTQIRASQIMDNPSNVDKYYKALSNKKNKTSHDRNKLNKYNRVVDLFGFTPYELYLYYVSEDNDKKKPLSELLETNQIKNLEVLAYLFLFFQNTSQDKFASKTQDRLIIEANQVIFISKRNNNVLKDYNGLIRRLKKHEIYFINLLNKE